MGFRPKYRDGQTQYDRTLSRGDESPPGESEVTRPPHHSPRRVSRASKLGAAFVGTSQLQDDSVTGAKIAPGAVIADALSRNAQGFSSDITFSASDADTVAWSAGTLTFADGDSFSIVAGNTGNMAALTYIYFDEDVSTTVLQTSTTFSDATGENAQILAVAKPAPAGQEAFFVPAVGALGLNSDQLGTKSVTADKLTENSQGFNTDVTFSASDNDTVAWSAGTVRLADGSSYSINANNSGNIAGANWVYFDPDASTTELQITSSMTTATGERKVILAYIKPAPAADQDAFFVPAVGTFGLNSDHISANAISAGLIQANAVTTAKLNSLAVTTEKLAANAVTAAKIAADTITANEIATNTITAAEMNVAQLSAISADAGTLTAGLIKDSAGKVNFDLDARIMAILDEQSPAQTRIRFGEIDSEDDRWGLEVYDSDGELVVGLDGLGLNLVGAGQVKNKTIPLERLLLTMVSPLSFAAPGNWFPAYSWLKAPTGTITFSDGDLIVMPWMPGSDLTVDGVGYEVTAGQSGDGYVVIYEDNGSFYPGEKIYESSAMSISATGFETLTTGVSISLVAGRLYWVGVRIDWTSSTPTLRAARSSQGEASSWLGKTTASFAPDLVGYKLTGKTGASAPDFFDASAASVASAPPVVLKRSSEAPTGGGAAGEGSSTGNIPPLAPPTLTGVSATDHDTVVVRWEDRSTDETEFDVAECSGTGCEPTTVVHTRSTDTPASTGTAYSWTRTSRTEDTRYRYRARCSDGVSDGDWSTVLGVLTPLAKPTGVSAAGGNGEVTLAWTDVSTANTDYRVRYRATGTTTWSEKTTGSGTSTGTTVTGLSNGTEYEFEVRAEKSDNQSEWTSRVVATTTGVSITKPELHTLEWDGTGPHFELGWIDNASDETGYEVWRVQGTGDPFSGTKAASLAASTTSYTDSVPDPNSGNWTYGILKKGGTGGDEQSNTLTEVAGLEIV